MPSVAGHTARDAVDHQEIVAGVRQLSVREHECSRYGGRVAARIDRAGTHLEPLIGRPRVATTSASVVHRGQANGASLENIRRNGLLDNNRRARQKPTRKLSIEKAPSVPGEPLSSTAIYENIATASDAMNWATKAKTK